MLLNSIQISKHFNAIRCRIVCNHDFQTILIPMNVYENNTGVVSRSCPTIFRIKYSHSSRLDDTQG